LAILWTKHEKERIDGEKIFEGYCFLIQLDDLCLFTGYLRPFTFKVMIERYLLFLVVPV
jgi:hypothetical protein